MRNLLLALAFFTCFGVPAQLQAADAKAFPVAVIDLEEVFNNANTFAARKELLQKQGAGAQEDLKKLEGSEKELKGKLSLLPPTNPEYAVTVEALEILKVRQKIYLERMRGMLERGQVELLSAADAEVRSALKVYCEEQGWKIVMLASNQQVGRGNLQETQLQLGMKSVLYAEEGHDITLPFIAWFNGRMAAAAAPATSVAPESK